MISWHWCLNEQRVNCWKGISAHFNCPFLVLVSITSSIYLTMLLHSIIFFIIGHEVSYWPNCKLIGLFKVQSTCFIRKDSLIPREVIGTVAGTTDIGCTILCNNTINVRVGKLFSLNNTFFSVKQHSSMLLKRNASSWAKRFVLVLSFANCITLVSRRDRMWWSLLQFSKNGHRMSELVEMLIQMQMMMLQWKQKHASILAIKTGLVQQCLMFINPQKPTVKFNLMNRCIVGINFQKHFIPVEMWTQFLTDWGTSPSSELIIFFFNLFFFLALSNTTELVYS